MKELKVGNRVAVYQGNGRFCVTVDEIQGEFIVVQDGYKYKYRYHRKQCRLLKKKK